MPCVIRGLAFDMEPDCGWLLNNKLNMSVQYQLWALRPSAMVVSGSVWQCAN